MSDFPRVAIGVPVCGPPTWDFLRSLVSLQPRGKWMLVESGKPDRPYTIDVARNRLAQATLDAGFDYLLQVDQDAVLHPDTLIRLLSWDKPIVAALCFTRYPPPQPTIYAGRPPGEEGDGSYVQIDETWNWIVKHEELQTNDPAMIYPAPKDALRKVDFTGCHCMLVHRKVLEAMGSPWFVRQTTLQEQGTGIDRYFCEKAQAAGYDVYVDRSVQAGHVCTRSIGALDFMAYDQITDWNKEEILPGGKQDGKRKH